MEITGKLHKVFDRKSGISQSGKDWEAQAFMLEIDGQYPKYPMFESFNKCAELAALKVGDEVTVSFELDSSEYKGNYYAKVKALNISKR